MRRNFLMLVSILSLYFATITMSAYASSWEESDNAEKVIFKIVRNNIEKDIEVPLTKP